MRRLAPGWFTSIAGLAVSVVAGSVLGLCAMAPPACSQGIDLTQGGPIQITAQDGIEWRQAEQMVIARGDARAVRANVTVTADRLIAWYRRRSDAATAEPAQAGVAGETSTEGNEVYRLRAEGNVHIFTATDQAWGDQATYDLDQAVLVMTGRALKLTTPNDTLTSRDTMEYWSQKRMAVARGDAVVVTSDARRVAADTLVAFTAPPSPGSAAPSTASQPPAAVPPGGRGGGPASQQGDTVAMMSGRLERVEGFNNVSVRTVTDIVTGDRGVYVPETGIARIGGHVRISRGMNQINGSEAVVNMKTGIATLVAGGNGRVNGLIVPNDPSNNGSIGNDNAARPARSPAKPGATP